VAVAYKGGVGVMFLNLNEKEAVTKCVGYGKQWGYGNMIHRLQCAWALHLIMSNQDHLSFEDALHIPHGLHEDTIKQYKKLGRVKLIAYLKELTNFKEPTDE
jgi:hypothetical protein